MEQLIDNDGTLQLEPSKNDDTDEKDLLSIYKIIETDFMHNILHGMCVSKLAYALAKEVNLSPDECQELAVAGMVHDIGKLKLNDYVKETNRDIMRIDELRYVRTHSTIAYAILRDYQYSEAILRAVLYHHENYNGTGYPSNLEGENIPYEARILRICDNYAALISNRVYRSAFDKETAMELMIEEIKCFDLRLFLSFQNVLQSEELMNALDNIYSNDNIN